MIEIVDLSYQYPDGKCALKAINLKIHEREKIALIGPNGAGKSTLLLHLNGTIQGEGILRVDGFDISKKNLPVIRSAVGMVFQNPDDQLFSLSVAEDVAFGLRYQGLKPDEIQARVQNALVAVHLEGYDDRHPFHLSSGEKKRASLATVLSMNPAYLVLDEPSANLDPRSRRELIGLLKTLPQSQIIATHDLALVRELVERVVVLNQGQIVADGLADEILSDYNLLFENGLV